jgi:hypothetical protein
MLTVICARRLLLLRALQLAIAMATMDVLVHPLLDQVTGRYQCKVNLAKGKICSLTIQGLGQ